MNFGRELQAGGPEAGLETTRSIRNEGAAMVVVAIMTDSTLVRDLVALALSWSDRHREAD